MVGMIEVSSAAASRQQVKRRPAPPRPDPKPTTEAAAKLTAQINALNARIKEIKSTLDTERATRTAASVNPEVIDAETRLSVLRSARELVQVQKQQLLDELKSNDLERSRRRAQAQEVREKLGKDVNLTLERVETRIRDSSGSKRQENFKLRSLLNDHAALQEEIRRGNQQRQLEIEAIEAKRQEFDDLVSQFDEQRSKMAVLRPKSVVDFKALSEERDESYHKMRSLCEERKKLREEFEETMVEWRISMQEHKEMVREDQERRHAEFLERQAERQAAQKARDDERQAARKAWEAEFFVEEFTEEILQCDQLLAWLNKQGERSSRDGPVNISSSVDFPALEGFVALPSKKTQEPEAWLAGKKGGKGKNPRAATVAPVAASGSKGKEKLSLSVDMLSTFSKLKVSPPLSLGDVSKSISELQGKRQGFVKLQAEAKARRERAEKKKLGEPEVAKEAKPEEAEDLDEEEEPGSSSVAPSEDPSSLGASEDTSFEDSATESPAENGEIEPEVPEVEVPEVEPEVEVPEVEPEVEVSEVEPEVEVPEVEVPEVEVEVPEVEPEPKVETQEVEPDGGTGKPSPVPEVSEVEPAVKPSVVEPLEGEPVVIAAEPAVTEANGDEVQPGEPSQAEKVY